MCPPKTPMDGIYRVKILEVRQDDAVYYIRYDIMAQVKKQYAPTLLYIRKASLSAPNTLYFTAAQQQILPYGCPALLWVAGSGHPHTGTSTGFPDSFGHPLRRLPFPHS